MVAIPAPVLPQAREEDAQPLNPGIMPDHQH
jgi:hypothetical protein